MSSVEFSIHDSEPNRHDAALNDTFCRQRVEFPLKEVFSSGEKSTSGLLDVRVYPGRAG